MLADLVAARGASRVAVLARDGAYGTEVGDRLVADLTAAGITVGPPTTFPEDEVARTALATDIASQDLDAVVVVGFSEGAEVVAALLDAGVAPDRLFGSEGAFNPAYRPPRGPRRPGDPRRDDGRRTRRGHGVRRRLGATTDGNVIYGAPTYDCAIVLALAVEAAGTTDGAAVLAEVPGVTRDGQTCTTYARCRDLLADGRDIDYDGRSGALDLDDDGDVTRTRYTIGRVDGGTVVVTGSQDATT